MLQPLFLSLAAACWAVMAHLTFHNKNDGPYKRFKFFGVESWKRKYERSLTSNKFGTLAGRYEYHLVAAPDTPYYDFFGIKYKEKFPWSATLFVFITDGYHLVQWFMVKFILLGFTLEYCPHGKFYFDWGTFLILWALWTLVFNLVYIRLKD